MQHIVLE